MHNSAIILIIIYTFCSAISCDRNSEKQPPNFIVILADDLGYNDLGIYGGKAKTPHMDRLA